jgi:Lon protease-like protein
MILLPGEVAQLFIFEERYRQLVSDWEESGQGFGIPYAHKGILSGVGSLVEVNRIIKKNPDGTSHIEIRCTNVFKISTFNNRFGERLYPGGTAEIIDTNLLQQASDDVINELKSFLKKNDPDHYTEEAKIKKNVYEVARLAKISDSDKVKLISRKSHEKQEQILMNHFRLEAAIYAQRGSKWRDIILN